MDQLFYAPDCETVAVLSEEESRHCVNVLRLRTGDKLFVTDGTGKYYDAVIIEADPRHCSFDIIDRHFIDKHWHCRIHVAIAPTKNNDRMEWFVEKATETGIDIITFLNCHNSERRSIKVDRMNRIAISAMKQSQKFILPVINDITDFEDFLSCSYNGAKFIAHCNSKIKRYLLIDACQDITDALILIGPEGDFTDEEINCAIAHGFVPVSLGESRLRTETAALTACITMHLLDQLKK